MAVPKRKMSKARRDRRRANWKLSVPGMVECPQCHEMKMPHRVCPECGSYNGKQVIAATMANKSLLKLNNFKLFIRPSEFFPEAFYMVR